MTAFLKEPTGVSTPRVKAWWENIPERWWHMFILFLQEDDTTVDALNRTNNAWAMLHDQWADKTKEC